MNTSIGLREQIAHAETEQDVLNLLQQGNSFAEATLRTKLSWKHTAHRRIQMLNKSTVKEQAATEVKSKKMVAKKPLKKK